MLTKAHDKEVKELQAIEDELRNQLLSKEREYSLLADKIDSCANDHSLELDTLLTEKDSTITQLSKEISDLKQ